MRRNSIFSIELDKFRVKIGLAWRLKRYFSSRFIKRLGGKSDIDSKILASLPLIAWPEYIALMQLSKAQLRQDIFALLQNKGKQAGYFVEFGATDGISINNTFMLEKNFDWSGTLAEPGRSWTAALKANRGCSVDNRAVWSESGLEVIFDDSVDLPELSHVRDQGALHQAAGGTSSYQVRTVSLSDLLEAYSAPAYIDFISIDIEGGEYNVLKGFDFSRWRFSFICIEHNYAGSRGAIAELLTSNGYTRILEDFSYFDDWYVPCDQIRVSC